MSFPFGGFENNGIILVLSLFAFFIALLASVKSYKFGGKNIPENPKSLSKKLSKKINTKAPLFFRLSPYFLGWLWLIGFAGSVSAVIEWGRFIILLLPLVIVIYSLFWKKFNTKK